jgi:hypothetical protein
MQLAAEVFALFACLQDCPREFEDYPIGILPPFRNGKVGPLSLWSTLRPVPSY